MPTRDSAPLGSPCWADLWTSDVEGSRRFYADLFGWEAQEPSPEFGGYFMFTREGAPVAGCMGDMGDMRADDRWKIYLDTDDIARTDRLAEAAGAQIIAPAMPVADLGIQTVLVDPTGAHLGAWEAGTFPGFTVLGEHGAPSWFELHTRDHPAAADFYRSVFGWEATVVGDTESSATPPCATQGATATWPASSTPPPSCLTGYRPTGRPTGRSTTPTSRSPWSRPSAGRS